MNKNYRDEFTDSLGSRYARQIFFGIITLDDVPEKYREDVKKDLIEHDLKYLTNE